MLPLKRKGGFKYFWGGGIYPKVAYCSLEERGFSSLGRFVLWSTVHSCGRRSNNRRDSPIRRHLLSLQQAGNGINQTKNIARGEKSTTLALLSVGVYLVIMYAGLGGVGGAQFTDNKLVPRELNTTAEYQQRLKSC